MEISNLDTILFQGCTPQEIDAMLHCLQAEKKHYAKGAVIYAAGDCASGIGLVLSGSVSIENDDIWGNKSILDTAGAGQVFAEAYACVPQEALPISVVAAAPTEILFLQVEKLLRLCSNACPHHARIIQNLLLISARKNLQLSRKIFHTSAKSIRGRLLSYLSFQAKQAGSLDFHIPFNRQQLADYLNVERSALSHELGKMQREGLLTVRRNHFILTDTME